MNRNMSAIYISALALASLSGAIAAERTTPVEVTNTPSVTITNTPSVNVANVPIVNVGNTPTVKIDPTSNVVKIDAATNTVKAQQSGAWNVAVTSMPGVSISNVPTVKIDSVDNLITAKSRSTSIYPWSSATSIAAGTSTTSPYIDCGGYKEMRVVISTTTFITSGITVGLFVFGNGSSVRIGTADWGTGSIATGANFTGSNSHCVFTAPTLSNTCYLVVTNNNASPITLDHVRCWVYLTN